MLCEQPQDKGPRVDGTQSPLMPRRRLPSAESSQPPSPSRTLLSTLSWSWLCFSPSGKWACGDARPLLPGEKPGADKAQREAHCTDRERGQKGRGTGTVTCRNLRQNRDWEPIFLWLVSLHRAPHLSLCLPGEGLPRVKERERGDMQKDWPSRPKGPN